MDVDNIEQIELLLIKNDCFILYPSEVMLLCVKCYMLG